MNKEKTHIFTLNALVALMFFFTCVSISQAAGPAYGPGMAMASEKSVRPDAMARGIAKMKWWHNDALSTSMNLTTLQKDNLETNSIQQKLAMIDLRASVEKTRLILETSLDSNFRKETSSKYLDDYLKAKNAFEEARMKGLINTREILTEEQFKVLKNQTRNLKKKRQSKMRE